MHVVVALGRVFLRAGLGIDEHVVLVPSRQNTDSWFTFSVYGLHSLRRRVRWKAGSVPGRVWRTSHQATLGLGHPATVQCSFRVLPSHTVCPRGLMMNSGGCVRLSGFIFLRNSDHSSICSERVKSGLHVNVWMCSITTPIQIRLGGILPSWSVPSALRTP